MKSTKTVLAVAILGFAYAVGAGHPQIDSLKHSHCCGPTTWDYWSGVVVQGESSNPISGAGLLHGVWIVPPNANGFTRVVLWDGDPDDGGVQISYAHVTLQEGAIGPQFVQLDVAFENGIFLAPSGTGSPLITILYKQ